LKRKKKIPFEKNNSFLHNKYWDDVAFFTLDVTSAEEANAGAHMGR
jgi:hypothetical protein